MSSSIFRCAVISSSSSSSMSSIFNRFHIDMGEPERDKRTYYKGILYGCSLIILAIFEAPTIIDHIFLLKL
jgi:hypothetical protein